MRFCGLTLLLSLVLLGGYAQEENPCPEETAAVRAPIGPRMEIRGNGYIIYPGDTHADDYDQTWFGNEYLDENSTLRVFEIRNTGDEDLILNGPVSVIVLGEDPNDFHVSDQPSQTIPPGFSTTFSVYFEPQDYYYREAVLAIYSNDPNDNPYAFTVEGYCPGSSSYDDTHVHGHLNCGMASQPGSGALNSLGLLALLAVIVWHRRRIISTPA